MTEVLRITGVNTIYTPVTPLCFMYQPLNRMTGNICGKLFLHIHSHNIPGIQNCCVALYDTETNFHGSSQTSKGQYTVPSTLSPGHPQKQDERTVLLQMNMATTQK